MTLDELAREAVERIHAEYWAACDTAQAALDPRDLTSESWVVELLAEAHDIAIRREQHELGWRDSADFF